MDGISRAMRGWVDRNENREPLIEHPYDVLPGRNSTWVEGSPRPLVGPEVRVSRDRSHVPVLSDHRGRTFDGLWTERSRTPTSLRAAITRTRDIPIYLRTSFRVLSG